MKVLVVLFLFTTFAMAESSHLEEDLTNQEHLVIHDLEKIQSYGKKWKTKLKKATTANKSPVERGLTRNEG